MSVGLVFPASAGGSCAPAPAGVIGWWAGDGNASTFMGTNNGTLQGTANATNQGINGNCFTFDGTNSFVAISNSVLLQPTNLTIEAWIRFSGLDSSGNSTLGDQYIIFKQNTRSGDFEGFDLGKGRAGGTDYFRFIVTSSSGASAEIHSSTLISTGVWYHVAAIRGSNFTQLYINGVLERQTNVSFTQDYGNLPVYFGTTGQGFWDHRFKGNLDEVTIYNRALSSNEIAAIYSAGTTAKCKQPDFSVQPQGQTVGIGGSAVFTVTASGVTPLAYQWRFNGTNLPSATTNTLTISNAQAANAGDYFVVATNSLGSATSTVATLVVITTPSISTQPQSRTNITGTTATFSVSAGGSPPLSYQWFLFGNPVPGGTTNPLVLNNVQPADGGNYNVVITNSVGSVTSATATLTVYVPPSFTLQPQSRTNVTGTSASFSATATGTLPLSYQWRLNGNNLPGATDTTFSLAAVQPADAGNYGIVVTNVGGAITSAVASLTVWVPPGITTPPQSRTNISGTTATFNVTASGTTPLSYQWQFNGGILPAATASSVSVNNVQSGDAGNYAVVVTNSAGVITSAVASLTVWVPPSISAQPQSRTNITGTSQSFSVTAGGTPPLAYQWRLNGNNLGGATASILNLGDVQLSDAGNYTVVITNSGGSLTSAVASLTVWVPPTISSQPQSLTNIAGTSASFSVGASGTTPFSYQWKFNGTNLSGATTSTLALNNVQPTDAGNYSVVVTNFGGSITSALASFTVWVPPSISSQPQSRTNISGTTASFFVTASGTTPFGYQWQFNGANIAGATASSFSLGNAQPSDAGSYSVVVTNFGGSITSSLASLTVWVPPTISSQPQSLTNIAGTSASFSVGASGTTPFSYQWQFNGGNLAGATASTLSLNNAQPSDVGNYSVIVTNFGGSITSAVASLTVWVPPSIGSQPQSRTNISGTTASFLVVASGTTPFSYQWQFNGANIPGATASSLSVGNVQPADAGNYSVVVTNFGGSITSALASLTVWVPPSITSQPQSLTNIAGTSASFTVTPTGTTPFNYQWQFNGANLSAATASTLTLNNVQPSNAGNYSVVVTNFGGSITSVVASLTVWVPPTISAQPQSRTNISGTTASFFVTASGTTPFSFQWQFNGANIAGATASSFSIGSVQASDAGNYSVVVTNFGGSVTSAIASLTVWVPPSIGSQPQSRTNLAGTTASFAVMASGTIPLSYQWQFNGANLPGGNASALSLNNVQPSDAGPYSVIVTNFGGSLTSSFASLVVWVPPTFQSQPQGSTNIFGTSASFTAAATGTVPLSYQWRFNGADIPGATTNSLAFASVDYTNSGNYTLVVTNVGGTATSSVATLLVIEPQTVLVCDPNLEAAVRREVGKPTGNLNRADFRSLTSLRAYDSHVANLCGLEWATNLTLLYLGGNLITDLSPLTNFTSLKTLFLYNNRITDLSPIAGLTNLSYLDVRANVGISNLAAVIPQLNGLTNLFLGNNGLSNLTFVAGLTGLRFLGLDNNLVSDLSPLAALTNLTGLDLSYNALTNLSQLPTLASPNLATLHLSGNAVTNIGAVAAFNALKELFAYNLHLADLTPVSGLTNLTSLNIGANPDLVFYSALNQLTNLSALWVEQNSLSSATFVSSLSQLTLLDLNNNRLQDLAPLAGLRGLRRLAATANQLTNIAPVSALTNLVSLDLSTNYIEDASPIGSLAALKDLRLRNNAIRILPPLSNGLESLDAGRNPFLDISALELLTSMSQLRLDSSSLTNIAVLQSLLNLKSLDLGNNLVSDISPLLGLSTLTTLKLAQNLVLAPAGLASSLQLVSLDLSFNPAPAWSFVSKLTNLTELALQGNSLIEVDFLKSLTNLASLDLSANRITNCAFATNLTALHFFMAGNNRLPDITSLTLLPQLWTTDLRTNLLDLSLGSAASDVINTLTNRFVTVYSIPQNQAPSIVIPGYWPIAANATSAPLLFSVFDDVTPANQLIVTATSSNTVLIPNSSISIGVSNSSRTLVVSPAANQTGNDLITVTVTDDTGLSTNTYLLVSVVPGQAVSIPDPNLRSAIRSALSKPSGTLSNVDMLLLDQLSANGSSIGNLIGLEWASNLVTLSLSGNSITNVQPLGGLSRLSALSLDGNRLSDGSPLSTLFGLNSLQLNNNPLTNIAFLQPMFSLDVLNLENDYITDLSPLAALTNVNSLFLRLNLITNIFAIQNLPNLSAVDLTYNLLDLNAGSGASSVIQSLQARAVAVIYLPQRPPPAMSLPATWAIPSGTFSFLPFTVTDGAFPPATIALTVASSNSDLLPNSNLALNNDALGNWTLRAVPISGAGEGSFPVTFTARNPAGLTSTQDVTVFVVTPQAFGGQTLNNTNLQWNTWGFSQWFTETNITHDGASAAQSGPILDTQESWLGTVITGPGRLSYWWKVSSEFHFDFLELYINGVLQSNRVSGELDWQMQTLNVPPGTNSFRWRYAKDKDTSGGLDAGWLDEVSFTPGVWLEIAGPPTNNRVTLIIHAIPGALYELQVSSNLVTWTEAALVIPTNTAMVVIDNAASTAPRYYRLRQLSLGAIFFDPPMVSSNKIMLVLRSPPALRFDIQTSTNLANWNPLMTVTNVSGIVSFTNMLVTNNPRLFYRAKLLF